MKFHAYNECMDTIVYLRYEGGKQNIPYCSYSMKEHFLESYRVITVKISENASDFMGSDAPKGPFGRVFRKLRRRHYEKEQERIRLRTTEEFRRKLAPLLQEYADNYVCFDDTIGKDCWVRTVLPLKEFRDFTEYKWVRPLLKEAVWEHFVVLGDGGCLQQVLWELAPRMKSLLWIAPDENARVWLEDFAEDFYQETGLALQLQFLPEGISFGQLAIPNVGFKGPVNVLDFNCGGYIPRFWPPGGSVWLDLASRKEKEVRICTRGMECQFQSLRKQWKNL